MVITGVVFGVGMTILRYQVEGETNLPFEITKISIISSVDGKDNKDDSNKWNITVNQNNDIYIYIDKNNSYNKTEIIDSIIVDNISIYKEKQEKGQIKVYKPTEEGTAIFDNNEKNSIEQLVYTGELESNIKKLQISNQGGIVVLRVANENVTTFTSNDAEQVDYNKLLKETGISYDDLKAEARLDLTIKLTSGKSFKTSLSLDIPVEDIVEKGTSSKEITDKSNIVFKRVENN